MRKLANQADFWKIETDEDHQDFYEHRGSPPFAVTTKAVPLVVIIKENGDESSKAHAVLCDIYHHAIMDEFSKAEGLLVASHLQEEVQNMDKSTKLLLYRVVAQLGLCAFRNGLIEEAYSLLCQLYENGRVEEQELLARGFSLSQFHEDTSEQTILEFLEVVYLICAMLVEDPDTGSLNISVRKSGENLNLSRIMVASRAFSEGLYHKSFKIIESLGIWKCLESRVPVLGMLKTKMK
ncbi:Ulp1 peptidase [Ranunculus cassubicifolius]